MHTYLTCHSGTGRKKGLSNSSMMNHSKSITQQVNWILFGYSSSSSSSMLAPALRQEERTEQKHLADPFFYLSRANMGGTLICSGVRLVGAWSLV